jgi:prevent-host-death family protein
MDVGVSELRANLSDWLERVRDGDEVVVTDRGVPVARLLGIGSASTVERLVADGVIARPTSPQRPTASGASRPRPRRPVAPLIDDQRR